MKQEQSTHCLETLMTLGGSVGAELRLGWFTCCSILVSPTADVLERRTDAEGQTQINKLRPTQQAAEKRSNKQCRKVKVAFLNRSSYFARYFAGSDSEVQNIHEGRVWKSFLI